MIHIFVVAVISIQCLGFSCADNWPWEGVKTPQIERVLEGQDVVLRCPGRLENATAYWEYKACGSGFNMSSCSGPPAWSQEGWRPLEASSGSLQLRATNTSQAGLYRCRQPATPRINLHSAVQLEVIADLTGDDTELPRFLDGLPKNLTVYKDTQAVFQCKVVSRSPPSIRWVSQGLHGGAGSVRYLQRWYAPLQPAGELLLPGHVRISKMVLPRARRQDEGHYFCVAVNTRGFTNSSAYLQVLDDDEEVWTAGRQDTWPLYLLFLLPVALALIPVSLWLCYAWRRQLRLRKLQLQTMDGADTTLEDIRSGQTIYQYQ